MTALVFAPLRNTHGKRDADEFSREARAFVTLHKLERGVAMFDPEDGLADRRAAVLRHVEAVAPGSLTLLALFCHGWPDGVQAGFRCEHVRGLARELKAVSAPALTVALYCCSAGADQDPATLERSAGPGGDGGFADRLRDELCDAGVAATVFAHSTAGHATRNPHVRVFAPGHSVGGEWLVSPHSEQWPVWLRRLHETDLRLRYPLLSHGELQVALDQP